VGDLISRRRDKQSNSVDRGLPVIKPNGRAKDPPPWVTERARDRYSTAVGLLEIILTEQSVAEKELALTG
jgi:hypothetical protein